MPHTRKARFWEGPTLLLLVAACGNGGAPEAPTAAVEAGIEASVADVRAANAAAAQPLPPPETPPEPAAKR
jgi:hypothetical protein